MVMGLVINWLIHSFVKSGMSTSAYQVPSWEPGAESKSDQAMSPPTSCADGGGGLLLQKYKTNGRMP